MSQTITFAAKRKTIKTIPTLAPPNMFGWLGGFRRDPLGVMTRARECGDLVRLPMGPQSFYVVNEPASIQRILQDNHRNYSKATRALKMIKQVSGENIFTGEGEFWLKRRRLMQPMFHRQQIAVFGSVMQQAAQELLIEWAARADSIVNVDAEMMRVTLKIVGRALFSVDLDAELDALGENFSIGNEDLTYRIRQPFYPPRFVPTPRNRRAHTARQFTRDVILRLIRERLASQEQKNDLLGLLIAMRDPETGEGLTEQELYRETLVMLFAGHETTSNALTWAWYFISQHPDVEAKLRAELDSVLQGRAPTFEDIPQLIYTRRVLDETMRLTPPAWILGRIAAQADMLGEHRLPARATILISPYTMHRHPRYWHDPGTFDPERFASAEQPPRFVYMPFGAGPRVCIGQPFALAEATLLLATIAQRFHLQLAPHTIVETEPQITLRVKNGLPMQLLRR